MDEDIDDYFDREVKPNLPNSWMDRSKDKVGYEISFIKYFYKFKPLRELSEIIDDMTKLDKEINYLSSQLEMIDNKSILIEDVPKDWLIKKLNIFSERKEINFPQTDVLISLTHDRGVIHITKKVILEIKKKMI